MLAKIHRRFQKLNLFIPEDAPWADLAQHFVDDTMESTRKLIAQRSQMIGLLPDSAGGFHAAKLTNLEPYSDTVLSLPIFRPFLEHLDNFQIPPRDKAIFDEKCVPRIDIGGSSFPEPNLLKSILGSDIRLTLMDLELWVSNSFDSWLSRIMASEDHFEKLAKIISWYLSKSLATYINSPENFSVMILTLMLLWVALDKAAIARFPILSTFDTGFPSALLDPLLLPKRHQMAQLRNVEKYVYDRRLNAVKENPSIFGDISSQRNFGAQFFDRSLDYSDLKAQIEKDATDQANKKKAELRDLKAVYSTLMEQSNLLRCTLIATKVGKGRREGEIKDHSPTCPKCKLKSEAEALKIQSFEWPLPKSEQVAKSIVFELDVPHKIRIWRSITYRILADVLNPSPPVQAKQKGTMLTEYEGLRPYLKSEVDRVQLASSAKPQSRLQVVTQATEDNVCIPNRLNFTLHDSMSQRPTSDHLNKYNIHERCTLKLPRGCYETLQYAIDGTKHTPGSESWP